MAIWWGDANHTVHGNTYIHMYNWNYSYRDSSSISRFQHKADHTVHSMYHLNQWLPVITWLQWSVWHNSYILVCCFNNLPYCLSFLSEKYITSFSESSINSNLEACSNACSAHFNLLPCVKPCNLALFSKFSIDK